MAPAEPSTTSPSFVPFAFWQALDRRARIGLVTGATLIVTALVVASVWLLRTDWDVLFAELAPADAAAMSAELDRLKVPWKLAEDGQTLLVDRRHVHATRLKLMGKELPLQGAVGLELFNHADFGMTEFAQKINYQRALQGELTRTIQSLAEVEQARVHLAFAEERLFNREGPRAKAAVTLSLKRGATLRPEQVTGIQRLVAASVQGVNAGDVTIVDRQGVALTRGGSGGDAADLSPRHDLKAEIEQALAKKAMRVLDRVYGEGRALASVDVTLDLNQVRVTTEDVIGHGDAKAGETPTGVVVRERETVRDENAGSGASLRETDYQAGRRVEQVIRHPGGVQRIQLAVVVRDALTPEQVARVKALLGAAVGIVADRGDGIVVQTLDSVVAPATLAGAEQDGAAIAGVGAITGAGANPGAGAGPDAGLVTPTSQGSRVRAVRAATDASSPSWTQWTLAEVLLGLGLLAFAALYGRSLMHRRRPDTGGLALDASQRDAALGRLRGWLSADGGSR